MFLSMSAGVLVLGFSATAAAFSTYPAQIPNGLTNRCSNCHLNPGGGGAKNSFGEDADANQSGTQVNWAALCPLDSDADGQTNGFELGDPACVWTAGANAARTTDISRPGDPASTSAAEGEGEGDTGEGEGDAGEGEGEGDTGGCDAAGSSAAPVGVFAFLASIVVKRRRK
jgi:hypothetical protein